MRGQWSRPGWSRSSVLGQSDGDAWKRKVKARERGCAEATHPSQGVKGFEETGRDRHVSDEEFWSVWKQADQTLPDGALWVVQNKTQTRAIDWTGGLAALVD